MEICWICGRMIDPDETPFLWGDHITCSKCNTSRLVKPHDLLRYGVPALADKLNTLDRNQLSGLAHTLAELSKHLRSEMNYSMVAVEFVKLMVSTSNGDIAAGFWCVFDDEYNKSIAKRNGQPVTIEEIDRNKTLKQGPVSELIHRFVGNLPISESIMGYRRSNHHTYNCYYWLMPPRRFTQGASIASCKSELPTKGTIEL